MSDAQPQLHMRRHLSDVPPLSMPPGYRLRNLGTRDADLWMALLQENGELGEWTAEKVAPLFMPNSSMLFGASFMIFSEDEPVATAQLNLHPDDEYAPTPELGWVAASPRYRGKRLGTAVCTAVLRHAAAEGYPEIFLRTDDHRLPAIRLYLDLGFQPWHRDPSSAERWEIIRQRLER
jgi:mycothiol synthase